MQPSELDLPPITLPQPVRLLIALSALCARQSTSPSTWLTAESSRWVKSVCKLLEIDPQLLPPTALEEGIEESAKDQIEEWSDEQKGRIAGILAEASLAASRGDKSDEQLRYTPLARAWSYRCLMLLGLEAWILLPEAEKALSANLFTALQASAEEDKSKQVESAREANSQGWGGKFGRHLATGAGIVAGGVLVGVTGGLAAPAIAALLAPLGIGGLLAGGAAPVVLGTLFGVGGGGLAGKRVRERWKGVEEFSFIGIGAGSKATKEEIEDLREARKRIESETDEQKEKQDGFVAEKDESMKDAGGKAKAEDTPDVHSESVDTDLASDEAGDEIMPDSEVIGEGRQDLEQRLLNLSLAAGTRSNVSDGVSTRASTDSGRPTLEQGREEGDAPKTAPSLTVSLRYGYLHLSSFRAGNNRRTWALGHFKD